MTQRISVSVSCKVSTYLPHGNAVGIGLSIPMTITLRPDMCINCPMTLDVVPPYFANALTSQPMLEFKDCSLQYVKFLYLYIVCNLLIINKLNVIIIALYIYNRVIDLGEMKL